MMTWWLMKTEPDEFSIDDLQRVESEPWTGIRNYQARNMIRDNMAIGDSVLIYHSSCPQPGIAGLAKVGSDAYADPTQFQADSDYFDPKSNPAAPRWLCRDVRYVRHLSTLIGLDRLRVQPLLADSRLLARGNRLSIFPVDPHHVDAILAMEKS